MHEEVSATLNFKQREKLVEKFWKDNKIFEKSMAVREGCPVYSFYDGPPTANGKPHIGHVLTRVIKDLIPRYQTMKGNKVIRKAGWDTHGLPVELEVEKMLGIDGKEQIEQYGLEPFIAQCKESVWKYKGMWEDFSFTVGFWADMDDPYVTYHNDYIESIWWSLKKIWDRGLLYKGYKIVPYCPRCGTPLSSHEVAQGYKDVKELSCTVRFKLKNDPDNASILAWTTTPWTLPSNVALCMGADIDYVRVRWNDEVLIMAEALVESVLGEGDWEIISRFKGSEMEYAEYEPLFDCCKPKSGKVFIVMNDPYVTISDGTGIVHNAPAFGEDDNRVCARYGVGFVQNVNSKGEMTENTPWAGVFCKTADKQIMDDLDAAGLLFKRLKFEHSYPHCWRCDTPLIYYARDSWFIKMTAVRDDLIANNNTVNWIPESIGKGRFGDWLENVQDWGISRNRYWGTPLPVWECKCGHQHAIGSIAELKEMSDNCPADIELHRPFIDAVTIKCPKCGGEMHRVEEVIDCWYDSGAMPFAQWHYPFENKDKFEENFPADFISEAVDQTRGWFYSLLAVSTLLFNKSPYKNVIVLGHVQDKDGQKMSKSKGNAVDPFDALNEHGADAIRWYFYENSAPWLPNRFHADAVTEGQRKFMGTLWNTYAFYVMYANISGFDATKYTLDYDKLPVFDKWLLSKTNTLIAEVDDNMSNYRIPETAKVLAAFVDELSNWYVRCNRERFWETELTEDTVNAFMTLYTALVTLCKCAAPMIPFLTEDIYQNLVRKLDNNSPESIHLCSFPVCDDKLVDKNLEAMMDAAYDIVVLGRAARNEAKVNNRQPLNKMYVNTGIELDNFFIDIIENELNVKNVEFLTDMSRFSSYIFKPQLKTLGPKYGKRLGEIRKALGELDGSKAMAELNETGKLVLHCEGGDIELAMDDVLIETAKVEGFAAKSDSRFAIALDTALTDELIKEGNLRELIRRLQTMRKDAGFNVTDRINIYVNCGDSTRELISGSEDTMKKDLLAETISYGEVKGFVKSWDLAGDNVELGVEKI